MWGLLVLGGSLIWGLFAANKSPSLAELVKEKEPWLFTEANSEQSYPLYLGRRPAELVRGAKPVGVARLPESLRISAEALLSEMNLPPGTELEGWPSMHWRGPLLWVFARRRLAEGEWRWNDDFSLQEYAFPRRKETKNEADRALLFADFLTLSDLFEKPLFSECVWLDSAHIVAAWLPTKEREAREKEFVAAGLSALCLPQPARLDGKPVTFRTKVTGEGVEWDSRLVFEPMPDADPDPLATGGPVATFPEDYRTKYRADLEHLTTIFTRKSSADPGNDLESLVDYLERRYRKLGLETKRQRFIWREIPQSNLVAILPGSLPEAEDRPVLVADHIDTAFAIDTFQKTQKRVAVPGADDNVTAVAGVLAAAEILKNSPRRHSIWLVHFTGEEFPADDLGARHFLNVALAEKREFSGLVLMDMLGHRTTKDDLVFQINAGESEESVRLGAMALGAAQDLRLKWKAEFRSRFSPKSYLYNTDGIVFSNLGYPVVFINEHIHAGKKDNPHYHMSTDVVEHVDVEYASDLAKVAIETARRISLAN